MPETFFHDVSIEMLFGGGSEEIVATVEFTATPVIPATYDDPAEGGEVEVLRVIDLFVPEVKAKTGTVVAIPRKTLDCPKWLEEMILENVDESALHESVDFSEDYREIERN